MCRKGDQEAFGSALGGRSGPGKIHEQSELVVDVEGGVGGLAEAHPVTFAFLVLFTVIGDQRGAVLKADVALKEIQVKLEIAGGRASVPPLQLMQRMQVASLLRNSTRLRGW